MHRQLTITRGKDALRTCVRWEYLNEWYVQVTGAEHGRRRIKNRSDFSHRGSCVPLHFVAMYV